jgi:hypothetical protein
MGFSKFAAGMIVAVGVYTAPAQAVTLVDGTTLGLYNNSIGNTLNGTSVAFPAAGDPTLDFGPGSPPDLSAAAAVLGTWLTTPAAPGGAWSGPQAIPGGWAVNTETAIIYEIDGGANGFNNVIANFGTDNGIFVWLNGTFLGGHLRPGGVFLGEFSLNIGNLGSGLNYLQVLLEDHGGGTGYAVGVTGDPNDPPGVPVPAALPLLAAGLGALGFAARRRSKNTA